MFRVTGILTSALTLLTLTACTSLSAAMTDTTFIADTRAASVAFRSLRVENNASGQSTVIKGQIHRTGHGPVRFGHVDYTVLDAQGKIREKGWVEHSSAIRLRDAHRPSLFSIHLKQPLLQGEKIKLSYHTGSHPQGK